MATIIKDLMREVDEAWDELQVLREGLKKVDEFIDAICKIDTDYLSALKAASDKYGSDFDTVAFTGITSLAETVSMFGAEETLRSLKPARKMRKYKEDKVDK